MSLAANLMNALFKAHDQNYDALAYALIMETDVEALKLMVSHFKLTPENIDVHLMLLHTMYDSRLPMAIWLIDWANITWETINFKYRKLVCECLAHMPETMDIIITKVGIPTTEPYYMCDVVLGAAELENYTLAQELIDRFGITIENLDKYDHIRAILQIYGRYGTERAQWWINKFEINDLGLINARLGYQSLLTRAVTARTNAVEVVG